MKIVVLDGYTLNPGDNPWDEIAAHGEFVCHDRTAPEEILERSRNADILLTNKTVLNADTLAELPNLKFICVLATGYNVVDVEAARERDIPVANVPIYGTDAVAEYVFALLLNHFRQPHLHSGLVLNGEWSGGGEWSFWRTPLAELAGKTIGIVGFGRIGRRVGEIASAFKMKVLANDPYHGNEPPYAFEWREIPELFAEADVVTLHCNLTPENTGMVDTTLLSRMKKTAYLINTSRGPLVKDFDLADALKQGVLAGAALDVVSTEPIEADSPLLKAPNITLTPHIAWAALEARRRLTRITAENIAAFMAGKPINLVNQ
ncbi:MAG: D-2-hydroxyacid dehydrogenase [Verrucomicrobia bacterium]|nr:MAG: D-2-hydroxyacid dehydrogenase [Verrucomicrobiota bacterium]